MKADRFSKTWFCYDFTKMVTHQPGKLSEPGTRYNALPSLCLSSQGLVICMLLILLFDFYSYLLSEGIASMGFITLPCYITIPPHFGFLTTCRSRFFWFFFNSPVIFFSDFQSQKNLYLSAPTSHPIICSLT